MELARDRDVVLFPVRPRSQESPAGSDPGLRVVGPGRRELGYQRRVTELQRDLSSTRTEVCVLDERVAARERELELAVKIERGSQRRLDRLETSLATAQQQQSRLVLALGALQRENEDLRARLAAPERPRVGPRAQREPGRSRGLLARLFSRSASGA